MALQYPYSEQAERAVLGAMLMDHQAVVVCVSTLYTVDFYIPSNQKIFEAIKNVFDRSVAVDITTVTNELEDMKVLEEIGGVSTLLELTESVVLPNVDYYIDVLKDKTNLRIFAKFLERTERDFNEKSLGDINVYLNDIEKEVLTITRNRRLGEFKITKDIVAEINEKLTSGKKGRFTGFDTGYKELNAYIQGWQPGDLVILAARPSVGKSALGLNFAYHTAKAEKKPVAFFSLEMPAEHMVQRMIASCGMIEYDKLKSLNFDNNDFMKFDAASRELSGLGIYIDDTPGLKLIDVQAKARKLKSINPSLCLIIIDYLNLLTVGGKKIESRQQEVAEISRGLKALARELNVPVIALAQLSRQVEQRGAKADKRPGLSDLRESGAIEQDADIVMFIYREDYYKKGEEAVEEDQVPVELIIDKHRNGARGTVHMIFSKTHSRFTGTTNNNYYAKRTEEVK